MLVRTALGRIALLALAFSLAAPALAWADGQKQVLAVYSTRRDVQVAILNDRELPRILEAGLGERIDFYSEYIDLGRLDAPGYQEAFEDFLALKYKGHRFDLLIAIQDVAVRFANDFRDRLFPNTPFVYVAAPGPAKRIPKATGLSVPARLADTVALASALQPEMREVFVVSGADGRDRVYEALAREQLKRFASSHTITYLAGLPTRELESRLSKLTRNQAVYYLLVNRDGDGASVHPMDYLDRLAEVSGAPIYSWVDSTLGHGIVGGAQKSLQAQTEALGQLALRVLHGESPDSIPVAAPNLNVNQVDLRQLQRWGISEARVPAGTVILFKEPSLWDRYKAYIIGAVVLMLAQTVLIAGLLLERRARERAETKVLRSEATLRASYDRIRDLGARLVTAQDEERAHLAREMHDDIGQQLALLTFDLQTLSRGDAAATTALANEALERTQEIVRSVRELSHRLHPTKLRYTGLVPALQGLQREGERSQTPIRFTHSDVPATLPPEASLTLFRVAQETLHNALKYSQAHEISMNLDHREGQIELTIQDDGVGFDIGKEWGKGLGLVSIGERLEAIGGSLEMESRPGRGTRVSVIVPVVPFSDVA